MYVAQTKDTMSDLYLDAVRLRQRVFVAEQGVPEEMEIDEYEAHCIHFVLYTNHVAVATCRLLPLENGVMKLQRIAVEKAYRGADYGRVIMEAAENFAKEQGYHKITLGAQVTAVGFYERLGYQKTGAPFMDAGIEHYEMNKEL
ncbi:GNAT family N-acetyltransferase [Enterococcus faecalis]|uniref:GNAT family N-acetyltransferase n=1 Tax=Enterococcus faecalis TaxID=1351 RepID=UPI00045B15EC|nr:GNAT family N-acetyltransferase [Enterococcus faecalis]KAJ86868.1 acetyltransferase, GNAT family [Enterococcus faecalis NY9]